jgi:hypothetical protein
MAASLANSVTGLETRLRPLEGRRAGSIPEFSAPDILNKPVDIYRSHLASLLSAVLGYDPAVLLAAIQPPNDTALGDLTVILPRTKPKEVTIEYLETRLISNTGSF